MADAEERTVEYVIPMMIGGFVEEMMFPDSAIGRRANESSGLLPRVPLIGLDIGGTEQQFYHADDGVDL